MRSAPPACSARLTEDEGVAVDGGDLQVEVVEIGGSRAMGSPGMACCRQTLATLALDLGKKLRHEAGRSPSAPAGRPLRLDLGDKRPRARRPAEPPKRRRRLHKFAAHKGREFQKHQAFRREHRLVDAAGRWLLSEELQAISGPSFRLSPARVKDLLHIIWLLFKQQGLDGSRIEQMWDVSQSLQRSMAVANKQPTIPGLHLQPRGRHLRHVRCPCILPRCQLWLNGQQRFARGCELLQMQGTEVTMYCPQWRSERDALLKWVAGNMYCLPVVGWYAVLALASMWSTAAKDDACMARRQRQALGEAAVVLEAKGMARSLLASMLAVWPRALALPGGGAESEGARGEFVLGAGLCEGLLGHCG